MRTGSPRQGSGPWPDGGCLRTARPIRPRRARCRCLPVRRTPAAIHLGAAHIHTPPHADECLIRPGLGLSFKVGHPLRRARRHRVGRLNRQIQVPATVVHSMRQPHPGRGDDVSDLIQLVNDIADSSSGALYFLEVRTAGNGLTVAIAIERTQEFHKNLATTTQAMCRSLLTSAAAVATTLTGALAS